MGLLVDDTAQVTLLALVSSRHDVCVLVLMLGQHAITCQFTPRGRSCFCNGCGGSRLFLSYLEIMPKECAPFVIICVDLMVTFGVTPVLAEP